MHDGGILILTSREVNSVLAGREPELIEMVGEVYKAHGSGKSSLPHSTFLHFPERERNRIIALPAYLGGDFEVAGMKWVSSFPANIETGLDRASAVMILNSTLTGRPEAVLEGSIISAKRTAASAALAAQQLHGGQPLNTIGLIGCGLINFEVVRFLRAAFPAASDFLVFDKQVEQSQHFRRKCEETFDGVRVRLANEVDTVLAESNLVSFATTAARPHVASLAACAPGSTILHVSLRDIAPEALLGCDNIVDDIDHVCRAQTSLHLAEQLVGHRDFIRCPLSSILLGEAPPRRDAESVAVFSPFGLGVLDIALAKMVFAQSREQQLGTEISSFLPSSWTERNGH